MCISENIGEIAMIKTIAAAIIAMTLTAVAVAACEKPVTKFLSITNVEQHMQRRKIALRVETVVDKNTFPQTPLRVIAVLHNHVKDNWKIAQIDQLTWTGNRYKKEKPGPIQVSLDKGNLNSPYCKGAIILKTNGKYIIRVILLAKNQNLSQAANNHLIKEAEFFILQGCSMHIVGMYRE